MTKIALLVGGPSPERGISLNSARSVADHLEGDDVSIDVIVYLDTRRQAFEISRSLLYSNTPDDFDFKLSQDSEPLSDDDFAALLRTCDLVFPVMHGEMGEDGEIQARLEAWGLPFVGSGSAASAAAYDKSHSHRLLRSVGVPVVPSVTVSYDPAELAAVEGFANSTGGVVLKPAAGGSSIGVRVLQGADAALLTRHSRMVLQPFVDGTEFTVVVLDGPDGPVSLIPVEVERRSGTDDILSYKDKYLATDDVRYHCPPRPRWSDAVVAAVRETAEASFRHLGLRDFARLDCWVVAGEHGPEVLVSDVNPISGMEQNSYLFVQSSQVGLTHRDILRWVVSAACRRSGIAEPGPWTGAPAADRRPIAVLFGGVTAERQVSVLSGSNVWMKLLGSDRYEPRPFLLTRRSPDEADPTRVWPLSYPVALRHSAEEIAEVCEHATTAEPRRRSLAAEIVDRLHLDPRYCTIEPTIPEPTDLASFLDDQEFVFIALHGGAGEDGRMQAELAARGIAHNGSGSAAAALCLDKYATSERLASLRSEGVWTARKILLPRGEVEPATWGAIVDWCGSDRVVVKPVADGCSAGVVPLVDADELGRYLEAIDAGATRIGPGRFSMLGADQEVEMPTTPTTRLMFEAFFDTDDVTVDAGDAEGTAGSRLAWGVARDTGWIEVTVGVLGTEGRMRALSPSLTIARQGVLSVEEKFMGGTGVNITPPPVAPLGRVRPEAIDEVRRRIELVAATLGLAGYARIDAFMHRETGEILVIEANTLPGLSPSTVLYHQALAEPVPMFPRELLEEIVAIGYSSSGR